MFRDGPRYPQPQDFRCGFMDRLLPIRACTLGGNGFCCRAFPFTLPTPDQRAFHIYTMPSGRPTVVVLHCKPIASPLNSRLSCLCGLVISRVVSSHSMLLHSVTCLATKDQKLRAQGRRMLRLKFFEDKPENGFQHEGSDAVPLGVDTVRHCSLRDIFERYPALRPGSASLLNGGRTGGIRC